MPDHHGELARNPRRSAQGADSKPDQVSGLRRGDRQIRLTGDQDSFPYDDDLVEFRTVEYREDVVRIGRQRKLSIGSRVTAVSRTKVSQQSIFSSFNISTAWSIFSRIMVEDLPASLAEFKRVPY